MSGLHGTHDLGHTVAGWTGTAIAVIGFCVAGAAMTRGSTPGLVLGAGVVAVAAPVTWVLHLSGWGKPSGPGPSLNRTGASGTTQPPRDTPNVSAAASQDEPAPAAAPPGPAAGGYRPRVHPERARRPASGQPCR